MSDLTLGSHLFSKEALDAHIATALKDVPSGDKNAVVTSVDASGVNVAVVIHSANGHWTGKAALEHDWTGTNQVAGELMYSW